MRTGLRDRWSWLRLWISALCAPLLLAAHPVADRWYRDPAPVVLSHGPLLAAVTDTGVNIWARASGRALLQVEVKASGQLWPGFVMGATRLDRDTDFTGVVKVDGLSPATAYDFRMIVNGRAADGGSFRTLLPAGQPGAFRFALGGDLDERFAPFTILDRIPEQRPDFGILLGDLIYSDSPTAVAATVDAYRAKYRTNWSDPAFRRLTARLPVFTMWDDHEIINDYDGAEPARYAAARVALEEYIARSNPTPRHDGDLYYSFQVGNVDFFVLDTRSHRQRNETPDDRGKTMLGPRQKADLESWLTSSGAPFKVVLSSVPFHDIGPPRTDSWNGFASERSELLEFIRQRNISGVVILSGDQHWSGLIHHTPYGVWEFNATPLAQEVRAEWRVSDPRLTLNYHGSTAFGLVDVDTRGARPRMTFSILDDRGKVRGSHTIGVESADGPARPPR